MITATKISEVRNTVRKWKQQGFTVGLVPTMGYLHEGHASLVDYASAMCDKVVVSDFVNPTQFSPTDDLEAYPRDFEHDCEILRKHNCDMVFYPSVDEMYPDGNGKTDTYVEIFNDMTSQLCGKSRPGHFRGVCTVVSKLFNIVTPDKAFFGEKDAQQLAVIRRMTRDMSYGTEIVGCPTVRESDGLAKSSRNAYLEPEQRKAAQVLYRALQAGKNAIDKGEKNSNKITAIIKEIIDSEPMAVTDYVSVVDGITMMPIDKISDGTLIAIAVYIGKTRLIDNFTYHSR